MQQATASIPLMTSLFVLSIISALAQCCGKGRPYNSDGRQLSRRSHLERCYYGNRRALCRRVAKRETTRGTSVRINGGRDFRLASVPVLVVGPEVVIDPQAEVRVERILYATDFLSESRRAMRYAYALAKHYERTPLFSPCRRRCLAETVFNKGVRGRLSSRPAPREGLCRNRRRRPARILGRIRNGGRTNPRDCDKTRGSVLSAPGTIHPALSAHLPVGPWHTTLSATLAALCWGCAQSQIWPKTKT